MIETPRLILRAPEEADHPAMWAQFRDPDVMRYLLPVDDDAAFAAMLERFAGYQRDHGFSFWSMVRRADDAVIGTCGLKPGAPGTPIAGKVEIGWRLARAAWGRGFAKEAAQATLDWAWANVATDEIFAITVPDNGASWGLMERLGMARVAGGDFDHPLVPGDSPLKRHIQYRIARPA